MGTHRPATRSIFGVMPDWNPAEIIGLRPWPLSLSLYRELVTDAIWAYQRDNYGYRICAASRCWSAFTACLTSMYA